MPLGPPQPEPEEQKKESKAWIAGAVVGPIVGLALIGLVAFLLIRRRKNKKNLAPAAGGAAAPAAYSGPQGPNSPPQYYSAPMQQNAGAPGMVPYGVGKHDSWAPQSPGGQGPTSPYASGVPQQWDGQNMQINQAQGYGVPSPSMSPQPQPPIPAQYDTGMHKHANEHVMPFTSELAGDYSQPQGPQQGSVPPRTQ